ncbi:cardioacceleratory peptide receptor-like isoform X1 [Pomacea canaliculata]|uniref:cardioacceleratory peptide receptor-like isoform X1 n=1 Tax=Pomacea canaliculata TaxID=400727 RepID=UPI000D72B3D0|nr:cardioacceleratory peptide receptor-like isoform X1 [Pomacea canaliculata]
MGDGFSVQDDERDLLDDYNYTLDEFINETHSMYDFYKVPQLVLVSTLLVFIVVGNCCVLAAIQLSDNGRKTRMNFFITHLAIADLLVGVICVLTDLLSKITVEWYAGNVMCKIIQYLQAAVTYVSTYVLVSLSLDRYDAVARPMNFSRSQYQARVLIWLSWVSALLFALPALFLYSVEQQEDKHQCWIDFPLFWHWKLFFTLVAVVTFVLPAIIIASCYIAIILVIWTKGHNSRDSSLEQAALNGRQSRKNSSVGSNERQWTTLGGQRHDTARGIIPQAKIRTVKMTLIIVIVFILCWSPFFLYNLLELYEAIPQNDRMSTFIQSAAPLNSAANPIIYGIFSTRICRNLRRLPAVAYLLDAMCRCRHAARKDYSAGNTRGTTASLTDQTLSTLDPHHKRIHSEALAASPGSLATRRPSGLPVVRRQLTEKEQQLLKRVTAGRQQLCPLITVEEPSHVDGFLPDKKNIKRGQGKKIEPDDISQIHTMIIESDDITEGL